MKSRAPEHLAWLVKLSHASIQLLQLGAADLHVTSRGEDLSLPRDVAINSSSKRCFLSPALAAIHCCTLLVLTAAAEHSTALPTASASSAVNHKQLPTTRAGHC